MYQPTHTKVIHNARGNGGGQNAILVSYSIIAIFMSTRTMRLIRGSIESPDPPQQTTKQSLRETWGVALKIAIY